MDLLQATDVFGHGFCATRSLFGEFVYERNGLIATMKDGPGRKRDPRSSEVLTLYPAAVETIDHMRGMRLGPFSLCVILGSDTRYSSVRSAYVRFGFRLSAVQPLFVLSLREFPTSEISGMGVSRIQDPNELKAVTKITRRKQLELDWLSEDDSPIRLYVAWMDGVPAGWVKSVKTPAGGNWVSDLYVQPDHRRKGIGKQLMRAMLADDTRLGVEHSVLLSSQVGAHLYPQLGYRQIGVVQVYHPPRGFFQG